MLLILHSPLHQNCYRSKPYCLKHFDNLETVFGTVNINIDSIADWAGRRDDIENQLKDGYVNPANKNQPIMFTV